MGRCAVRIWGGCDSLFLCHCYVVAACLHALNSWYCSCLRLLCITTFHCMDRLI